MDYDLTNKIFGKWKVLERAGSSKHRNKMWKCQCCCGSISIVSGSSLTSKKSLRCKSCAGKIGGTKNAKKKVHKIEYISEQFNKNGCTLLSKRYKNNQTRLNYICKCGNKSKISYGSFSMGRRCSICAKNKKFTIKEAKKIFKKEKCKLLENVYTNASTPMNYLCSCGKISKICLRNFRYGSRCRECGNNVKRKPGSKENRRFAVICREMVKRCFKFMGKKKQQKTKEILGYSHLDLKNHIESHPNFEKLKGKSIEIDHIFPIIAFLDNGIIDMKIINSLDNLQPLSPTENAIKNSKYDIELFKSWLLTKDIKI